MPIHYANFLMKRQGNSSESRHTISSQLTKHDGVHSHGLETE
jgi:hypothetical protein